ncbi:hypothetical protein DSUL_30091 [Desulfovibrionales bacterium]
MFAVSDLTNALDHRLAACLQAYLESAHPMALLQLNNFVS